MTRKPGTVFMFAGLAFLVIAIGTGKFSVFLSVGIALIVTGLLFQRYDRESR